MKRLILILFVIGLFNTNSSSQCPGALECTGSQVFCQVASLNGFTCSNPSMPNTGFPLSSLCRGAGVPHNINWWAFVGAGGPLTITFNFDIAQCTNSQGIQAGVFENNCNGTAVWDCNAACNTSTFSLSGATRACEIYYVWVDGCNGDVCTYTMSVVGNSGTPKLPDVIPPPVAQGPICVCGETEFCFPGLASPCEPVITWTVDGVPAGMQGDDCIFVEFDDTNPKQICVFATIGNPADPNAICDQDFACATFRAPPIPQLLGPIRTLCTRLDPFVWHGMPITMSCINPPCSTRVERADGCCVDSLVPFQILPPEVKLGLPRVICPEDQPFEWHGTIINSSCVNPPCTARLEGPDGCLIDSVRAFTLLAPRRIGMLDTFFCSIPPTGYRTEDNQVFRDETCDEEITFQDPVFGCDTSYNLNIRVFKYSSDWQIDCAPCDGAVTVCPNIEYDPDCAQFNDGSVMISLDWTDATGAAIGTTQGTGCLQISMPGQVCVDLKVRYKDRPCPGPYRECFNVPADIFPARPQIDGDSSVCGSIPGLYYTNVDGDDACEYYWTITTPGGQIISPNAINSDSIEIDWTSAIGDSGIVCLYYKSDCGVSEDTCFVVDFEGTPQINAGPDTNICASSYTMLGVGDVGGEWNQVAGPDMANIQDPTNVNTDVSVTTLGVYRFVYTESRDGCTSIDTVTIGFRPDPSIANIDTLCSGDATSHVVTFELMTGTAPYTIVTGGGSIDMNNVYTSDTIQDNTPTTITIRDTFGCETSYFIDYDCVCGNAVGEINNDTLKFCGSSDQACAVYDATNQVLVPGVDTFMYVLYSTPGMLQGSEISRNQTGCFTFDPMTMNLDQVYYIGVAVGMKDGNGTVDLDGGCLQIEEAQPVVWYSNPTPDAGMDNTVCGEVFDLTGLNSLGFSTYRWQNTAGVTLGDPNSLNTTATIQPGTHGTYRMVLEETNAICVSTDTVEITFFEVPEPINAREICLDSITRVSFDYMVCFLIQKGTPPYTIVQGGGSIDPTTNRYCSDVLMSLQVYDIIIEDGNGCQFTITGDHNCDCGATDPGTMGMNTIETCVDQCVVVQSNGTETVQPGEEAMFVLHEGSGQVIINELARVIYDHTANPAESVQFCFDPTMMVAGRVYYISRSIRDIGMPDDPCERTSAGQPVIWNSYPQSDAGMNQDVCGLTATLNALPSIGVGEWTLADGPAGGNAMLAGGMPMSMVTVDRYGTYTFQWKEDNAGCADSSSMTVTFHDAPRISNLFFECDDVAENYRIYIEVADGDAGSWDVTGVPIADQRANTFITDWIPSGTNSAWTLTDQWDCGPVSGDSTHICECITEPGTTTGADILCIDECAQARHNGGNTDGNDIVRFVLHDGDATTLGANIIACNANGQFCFDAASMTPNTEYFITGITGNNDGSNCVDLTDRCLGVDNGVSVIWYEYPTPDIQTTTNIFTCQVDSVELDGTASTGPMGTLNYQWTTSDGAFCNAGNTTGSTVWICSAGTYILTTTHAESGCATSDTIVIDRDQNLPMVTSGQDQLITCDNPMVTLDATGSDFGGNFQLEWLDPNNMVISNALTVTVSTPGIYTVRVVNGQTDCEDFKTVTVDEDVDAPTAVIDQLGQLSCIIDMVDLDGSNSMTKGGARSYTWSTTNGLINGASNTALINVGEPGDYQLIVVDDANGCADTLTVGVIEVGNTLETVDIDPMDPSCFGSDDGVLEVNVTGGVDPLMYSLNGGPFGGSNVFTNLPPGTYDVVVRDMNGCEKDTSVTIIEPADLGIAAKEDMVKEAGSSIGLDTLILSITGINPADADSIYWYDVQTGQRIPQTTIDSLTETTTFRVVIYNGPCQASDLITIFVKYTRSVFVPNVIFPGSDSGDPDNMTLTVHGNKDRIESVNFMRVYDRWGELVYSAENMNYDQRLGRTTEGWDGTFNGELMNPGVYIYHIEVAFFGSDGGLTVQEFFGDVTLIK